ncbi:unnamed protein product [Arctia plantaginis]|uniref:Uncharacterized protein n=1 Tax=Arctia plantaginis TaxID=874455 RepID=A0A8S1AWX1_ARCPL|nr:unnamed protein product [Arctia plantaginis]
MEYTSTPLHRASMNGRKEVVIALLDAGMDPNVRTANGTPLHEAARYGKASVVRVLLTKGADLHATDSKKKTVYDLLAEYPEEALRKVRKVIREYVTNAASYDSENEDLPPFPVPEYSPTPPLCNKFSPKLPAHRPLRTKASLTNINEDKQRDNITNSQPHSKFPPSPKSPSRSPVSETPNEDFRHRSNTFQDKASNNKQLKILGDSIKSNAPTALMYDHQNQVIYELAKKINTPSSEEIGVIGSQPEKETVYANLNNNTLIDNSYDRKRCDTLELPSNISSEAFESGSMKRKPKPLPKPTGSPGDDETDLYVNECFKKVEEGIYENVTQNISDDEKVKNAYSDGPELDTSPTYFPMMGLKRLHHQRSTINVCGHSCDNIETYDDAAYVKMEGKMVRDRRLSNPVYLSMERLKTDSFHLKGDVGCLYGSNEYLYIYEINPKTLRGNAHPFIRKKERASPMPCYCHEDPKKEEKMFQKNKPKQSSAGQLVFYSCEDIYVPMNREDIYSSLNDLKNENMQFQRKQSRDEAKANRPVSPENLNMAYQSNTKTSETQKNTNKYDSFLSPPSSSFNKHHPQSFVKKLASKCLGLKAKFNSAPNISNSSAAEVDVKSKQPDNRNSTNTLLIGNSKFFKMLSKKEESGEVVCNDEFDTISLDRLGTLNRDSVVNRSNRSCPGFKTSLPNISEHNELSDSQESIPDSVVITELDCGTINSDINEAVNCTANFNIFEPREISNRKSVISTASTESRHLVNECYESYDVYKSQSESVTTKLVPIPQPRPTAVTVKNTNDDTIYENIVVEVKSIPKPATRIHIPVKSVDEVQRQTLYENIDLLQKKQPEPHKRTLVPQNSNSNSLNENASPIDSRSSTMSSDSMLDETNLEDIFLSEKSKSFRHRKTASFSSIKLQLGRTQSIASDASDVTEASALENVDCSDDINEKPIYLSMTGTLPNKKTDDVSKKKVLFRHKTFTNIEVDRNSVKVKDLPEWNNEFLKETLAHYHIRGTGHCIYNAPTVQEFIYIFNRDTLYSDVPPFTKVPNTKRDSEFETAICFCRPRPPKFHSSAEDLIDKTNQVEDGKVLLDVDAIKNRREILSSSFKCYCVSKSCTLHSTRRDSPSDFVVKFSAIKKSISTPDITLDLSPYSTASKTILPKNKSVPSLEDPYAVVSVEEIIARNTKQCENAKTPDSPVYTLMSQTSTVSSTTSARPYSIKDIAEVISLSDHSTSTTTTLSRASGVQLPIRKSSSSEYSGHWSLQSCNSNVTIQSDASFKTCLEESSDDSDGTLHSDAGSTDSDSSDAETVKSDETTAKRPWVHSDSFRFGSKSKPVIDVIVEESQSSPDDKSESSKYESGICLEGSVSSLSECEDDSGIPRVDADVSLGCASLERVSGLVGGVRSGSGRRRWDEAEGTSEGDALSVSSAASSCAPLHLSHHHPYSKVSPTPPKKPPRRNLSVSPTHANSPSSGYSYELRPHARSQDDLDDIQGAKHYLKHGRSVDQYVDGKLSYSEYEENHNSPRVVPIPNPRPSLKQRSQPVAITAMYENVVIKEQNPRRKLRRNNFVPTNDNYDQRMSDGRVRKYSHQEKSSLESLLDDQSMNSPSDCERYYEGPRAHIPLSPTHYEQPPTPDHPPPSARQAENCIHERIRPLSQLIMEVVEEIRIRKMSQSDISNS